MARGRSIIVGGGLGAVGALAVGAFVSIISTDPASVQISPFLGEVASGVIVASGRTDPQAAATEVLRVKGGAIIEGAGSDSVVVGRGASNTVVGGVSIGRSCVSTGVGVCIGNASSMGTSGGVVIFGTNSIAGGGASVVIKGSLSGATGESVVIGGASITGLAVVQIGGSGSVQASSVVQIGFAGQVLAQGGVAIGSGATVGAGFTNSVVLGNGVSAFAAQQFNVGSNASGTPINTVVIGHGLNTTATPTGVLFRLTNASGVDNVAGNLTLQPGLSTGAGAPGSVIIQTGTVLGSSSTLQTAATRLTVSSTFITATVPFIAPNGTVDSPGYRFTGDANSGFLLPAGGTIDVALSGALVSRFDSSAVARDTRFMIYDVDNGAVERVSVGVADSGGVGFKLLRIPN